MRHFLRALWFVPFFFFVSVSPAQSYWADPPGGICSVWQVIATGKVCKCYQWGC